MGMPLPLKRSLDRYAALRACKRTKIFEPVAMSWDGKTSRAHLLDISSSGALIHVIDPPAPDTAIGVERGEIRFEAMIVWRDGARCGIKMQAPIDTLTIAQIPGAGSYPPL